MPIVRALIVHESICPATGEVVAAIAAGLTARGATVATIATPVAPPAVPGPVDLLVVVAPANPLRSRPAPFIPTVGLPVAGGLREWIECVDLPPGQPTATFDVRTRPAPPGPPALPHRPAPSPPLVPSPSPVPSPAPELPRIQGTSGSPARAAARRLRERGASIIGTRSFTVPGPGGRLDDEERGRVRDWTAGLVVEAAIHRVG